MISIVLCAAFALFAFGILHSWTLSQQSALFALLSFGQLYLYHRRQPVTVVQPVTPAQRPAAQATPPAYRPPNPSPLQAQAPDRTSVTSSLTPRQEAGLSFYQREALVINQRLEAYGIKAGIDYRNRRAIVMGYGFVHYVLSQRGTMRFEDVRKVEGDLAREINALHRKHQFGPVHVIAVDSQPVVLQVTRAKPQKLLWAERKPHGRPLQTFLGTYWIGAQHYELLLDFVGDDSKWINGAFFGQPGSGKSTLLRIALINLLETTPPEELEVYGIDLNSTSLDRYTKLPQVRRVDHAVEDALATLEVFAKWCAVDGRPTDGKYRLLLIDEFQMLMADSEYGDYALSLMVRILEAGRKSRIRVLTATQNPDAQSYPSKLKPRTHYMAAGLVVNDDYLRKQMGIYGASKLNGGGEFVFVGPVGNYLFTTYWMTEEDEQRAVQGLVRRWGASGSGPVHATGLDGSQVVHDRFSSGSGVVQTTGSEPLTRDAGSDAVSQINFPIRPARALTEVEAVELRQLAELERFQHQGRLSLNKLVYYVYGAKRPELLEWIKAALDGGDDE